MAELWFRCFEYYHAYKSGNTLMNTYVWCWSKICGSLDEILSLTMGSYESKIIYKFKYELTVLNLHQKTDPKVQQDFKGQGHYDKVKGQIKVTP